VTNFLDDYSSAWLGLALSDVCDTIEGWRLDDMQTVRLVADISGELDARRDGKPTVIREALSDVCETIESWGVNGLQMPDLILGIIPELASRAADDLSLAGIWFESDALGMEGRA
jgi:hypothetical protein